MNARERFLATARFQPVDRTFLIPAWAWDQTRERWRNEGMPAGLDGQKWCDYFETDLEGGAPNRFHTDNGVPIMLPPFERKIISKTDEYEVFQDEAGTILKQFTNLSTPSMPEYVEYPMKDRKDWDEKIKPRLQASTPGRCPTGVDLENWAASVKNRDYPLAIWGASFYGWPRSLMGVEQMSYMLYDDPKLIHEMCEHITDYNIELITPLLEKAQFDFAMIWEDMAGKGGPLCSPEQYREFMAPQLKRFTAHLRKYGIDIIIVDSDGYNDPLIPIWLESGVTGLRPYEIAAGCDPVANRRQYGKDLVIQGGIDKRTLTKGKEAIEREVLSKVPWLCLQGGYFPQVDHLVPPDVSLENYRHYAHFMRQVVEDPERYLHEAKRRGYWTV